MIDNNRGSALIFSYAVVMVLTVLGTGIIARNVGESMMSRRYDHSTRAFWLAEAGINRAIYELNYGGGGWSGWSGTNPRLLAVSWGTYGDFSVSVTDPASSAPEIAATGSFPAATAADKVTRGLNVVLERSGAVFQYAAFGKSALTISGNGKTDSYNPSVGYDPDHPGTNGDAGTNGDITGNGAQYRILGDAMTGPSGTFDDTDQVTGTISHTSNVSMMPMTVPQALVDKPSGGTISSSRSLPAGSYHYTSIEMSSEDTLAIAGPSNVYLSGVTSMALSGKAQVVTTGEVTFYVDGSVSITGQGIVNSSSNPRNLLIYGTASAGTFSLAGKGDFCGAVYSPNSTLHLSGKGGLYGSFIGDVVNISGNGGVHYDETLSTVSTSAGKYRARSWKESQNPRAVSE